MCILIADMAGADEWKHNNGMAPAAKLAFTDLGVSSGARQAGIGVPSNLHRDYFPYPWGAGARIFSESWGSNSAAYDALSRGTAPASHPLCCQSFGFAPLLNVACVSRVWLSRLRGWINTRTSAGPPHFPHLLKYAIGCRGGHDVVGESRVSGCHCSW
jgi:hypothetical protein